MHLFGVYPENRGDCVRLGELRCRIVLARELRVYTNRPARTGRNTRERRRKLQPSFSQWCHVLVCDCYIKREWFSLCSSIDIVLPATYFLLNCFNQPYATNLFDGKTQRNSAKFGHVSSRRPWKSKYHVTFYFEIIITLHAFYVYDFYRVSFWCTCFTSPT